MNLFSFVNLLLKYTQLIFKYYIIQAMAILEIIKNKRLSIIPRATLQ